MADFNDLYDYVTTTPGNTNRRILKSLVNSLTGNGSDDSSSGGVKIVDMLPENGNEGDICLVPKDYYGEPKHINEVINDMLNDFDYDEFFEYCHAETEEEKIAACTTQNLDDFFDKHTGGLKNKDYTVFPSLIENISDININEILDYETRTEEVDNEEHLIYHLEDKVWSRYESGKGEDGLYGTYSCVAYSLNYRKFDDDLYITYFRDGWFKTPYECAFVSAEFSGELQPIYMLITNSIAMQEIDETKIYEVNGEKRIDLAYFYIDAGDYEFINTWNIANVNSSRLQSISFNAAEKNWYCVYLKFDEDDNKWLGEISLANKEILIGSKVTIYADNLGEMVDFNENHEVVYADHNITDDLVNFYNNTESGIFVYKNNKWTKILTEQDKQEDLLKKLVGHADKFAIAANDSGNILALDNNSLYINKLRIYNSGASEYTYEEVDLSPLAGQNLYIRNIAYHSVGDTSTQYCYRAYYNNDDSTDDNDNPSTDTHYFDFYVDKPADLSNYALRSEIPERKLVYYTVKSQSEYGNLLMSSILVGPIDSGLSKAYNQDNTFEYSDHRFAGAKYIVIEQPNSDYDAGDNTIYHHSMEKFDWIKIDYSDLEDRVTALEQANQ